MEIWRAAQLLNYGTNAKARLLLQRARPFFLRGESQSLAIFQTRTKRRIASGGSDAADSAAS